MNVSKVSWLKVSCLVSFLGVLQAQSSKANKDKSNLFLIKVIMPTFIDILIGRGNGTCSRVRISFRIRGDLKGIINTLDDNLFYIGRTIIFTPRYTATYCIGNTVSIIKKFGNSFNCH